MPPLTGLRTAGGLDGDRPSKPGRRSFEHPDTRSSHPKLNFPLRRGGAIGIATMKKAICTIGMLALAVAVFAADRKLEDGLYAEIASRNATLVCVYAAAFSTINSY